MPGLTISNTALLGALVRPNITFVGSATGSATSTSPSTTFSFSSITVQADDLAIVIYSSALNSNIDISATGYTEVSDLYQIDTTETNLWVGIKKLTSSSDNSITITHGATLDTARASAYIAYVFRNVNTGTPQDVTATTFTVGNTGLPNPPSITPVTQGSIIVAVGAGSFGTSPSTFSNPSSTYSNFVSVNGSGSTASTVLGIGFVTWTSGAYDPPAFTYTAGGDSTARSSAATTLVLRPL